MTQIRKVLQKWHPRKHSIYTHFPKDRNCDICLRTKMTRAPCKRRNGEAVPRAENFGNLVTADHKVLSEGCGTGSRNSNGFNLVRAKQKKTSQETAKSLRKFLEPSEKPKVIYTGTSLEFGKSCEDFSRNHRTSTPRRSETNGIAERAVALSCHMTMDLLFQEMWNACWDSSESLGSPCSLCSQCREGSLAGKSTVTAK